MKTNLGVKASTRAFRKEGQRTTGYSWFDFVHGYVYGRWPYLYIGVATGEHWLSRVFSPPFRLLARLRSRFQTDDQERDTFADGYHGKVVPLEAARQLVTVQEPISLPDLEKIIPYKKARDIIFQNPDHIAVLECPCRSSRPDPCQPLDVCLVIGEPFASFIIEHHPQRARWITPQEAESVLEAEQQRGHVSHAFFKDAMLGRFYAICNCCTCCCGAIRVHQGGTPMLASSGYVAVVDEETCIGCGLCAESCQFRALSLNGDGVVEVSWEGCMGCGVCISQCQQEALRLIRDPAKGEPLEIQKLILQT